MTAGSVDLAKRFSRHKLAMTGLVLVVILVATAVAAPLLAPYSPFDQQLRNRLAPPMSEGHLLGTDELGRDILSRVIWGSRVSLLIGLLAVVIGVGIGVPLGILAAYYSRLEGPIMRAADVMLAFPGILLALVIIAILGMGVVNATIAIGIYSIPVFARLARAAALVPTSSEYVMSARALGQSDLWIMWRHVLLNSLAPIIVQSSFRLATAILTAAMLSFLGLGAQPPSPEWGVMLSTGRVNMIIAPHVTLFPGLAIFITVLAFNLLGDGLRDVLDPRLRDRN
jgi:ABC-type dipeptide/oligopeptide/nickel transport system permease subunit